MLCVFCVAQKKNTRKYEIEVKGQNNTGYNFNCEIKNKSHNLNFVIFIEKKRALRQKSYSNNTILKAFIAVYFFNSYVKKIELPIRHSHNSV